jgi:hypothetical protein
MVSHLSALRAWFAGAAAMMAMAATLLLLTRKVALEFADCQAELACCRYNDRGREMESTRIAGGAC